MNRLRATLRPSMAETLYYLRLRATFRPSMAEDLYYLNHKLREQPASVLWTEFAEARRNRTRRRAGWWAALLAIGISFAVVLML